MESGFAFSKNFAFKSSNASGIYEEDDGERRKNAAVDPRANSHTFVLRLATLTESAKTLKSVLVGMARRSS